MLTLLRALITNIRVTRSFTISAILSPPSQLFTRNISILLILVQGLHELNPPFSRRVLCAEKRRRCFEALLSERAAIRASRLRDASPADRVFRPQEERKLAGPRRRPDLSLPVTGDAGTTRSAALLPMRPDSIWNLFTSRAPEEKNSAGSRRT